MIAPLTALRPMLTVKAVAERLAVDPDTVRGWIASRELAAVNVSKGRHKARWRVDPGELARFEQRRSNGPPPVRPRRRRRRQPEVIQYF